LEWRCFLLVLLAPLKGRQGQGIGGTENWIAPMTVKQAIKMLEAMPDKEMKVMIDCPYCGKGNQLSSINECVVLSSPPEREK
jgi:hypothetical protein